MDPLIITGMHRSGTSAIARLVQALGVNLGSHLLGTSTGNIFGHFEEDAFMRFHDKLIARLFAKHAPFCEWLPLADAQAEPTDADRAEALALWNSHQAAGASAWKDPRTSLFLDLWTRILPEAKVIVCVRHPYQVHRSLMRRGEPFLCVDYSAGIVGSMLYNRHIMKALATLPRERFVVIEADLAFRNPRQLAELLAGFLGIPLTDQARAAIAPEAFHFEEESRDALEHFGDYLPEAADNYRQIRLFSSLAQADPAPRAPADLALPVRSDEARLIEFEQVHGLRQEAKKMLVRSVTVDRQRLTDLYERMARVSTEKDRLIEDLSRLADGLKRKVAELEEKQTPRPTPSR